MCEQLSFASTENVKNAKQRRNCVIFMAEVWGNTDGFLRNLIEMDFFDFLNGKALSDEIEFSGNLLINYWVFFTLSNEVFRKNFHLS